MDQSTFEAADPLIDEISELVDGALTSEQLAVLRQSLAKLSKAMGGRYSIGLIVSLEVFDHQQERNLPLLNTGLSTTDGSEPYRTWGDSTPQRYIVDGEIQVVPHDRCPNCWNTWVNAWRQRQCAARRDNVLPGPAGHAKEPLAQVVQGLAAGLGRAVARPQQMGHARPGCRRIQHHQSHQRGIFASQFKASTVGARQARMVQEVQAQSGRCRRAQVLRGHCVDRHG